MTLPRYVLQIGVVGIGLMSLIGHFTGSVTLQNLGFATAASPLPLVFTDRDGFEDFASRFFIKFEDRAGAVSEVELRAEHFSRMAGPFRRKSAYAAALIYAPVMDRTELWTSILGYGLCRAGVSSESFGLPAIRSAIIRIHTKTSDRYLDWSGGIQCDS